MTFFWWPTISPTPLPKKRRGPTGPPRGAGRRPRARVPHDALRFYVASRADDDNSLRLTVPLDVLDGAGKDLDFHFQNVLRVVPGPDPQKTICVARGDPEAVRREGRRAYSMFVAAVDEVVSRVVERSYDHVLAEAVDEFRLLRVRFH